MMNLLSGSKLLGTRIASTTLCVALAFTATNTLAQTAGEQNLFSEAELNLIIESMTQKPADQATPVERNAAIEELTGIYKVSNLPRSQELAKQPTVKAQIELQRRAIIYNAFATDFLASNQPTEQEIFNTYEEQVALAPPKEFKARHILVETQGAAVDLIEQLQSGADFVELAKANSTGPSAPSGGDLGWFTAQAMVKPFSDRLSTMEDGSFTKTPVQTQFGWHVILREDSRDSAPPPLDSVRDVIVQRISQQKLQDFLMTMRTAPSE